MRQVHNINEDYRHYYNRKYGLPNGLIVTGIFVLSMGGFLFSSSQLSTPQNFELVLSGIVTFFIGVCLIFFGIKLRISRSRKNFRP